MFDPAAYRPIIAEFEQRTTTARNRLVERRLESYEEYLARFYTYKTQAENLGFIHALYEQQLREDIDDV